MDFDINDGLIDLPAEIQELISREYERADTAPLENLFGNEHGATARSAEMFLKGLPLEVRQQIWSYSLPIKGRIFTVGEVKKDLLEESVSSGAEAEEAESTPPELIADTESSHQQALAGNKYEGTDNALTLLLVNSQVCSEVATMLYENYEFELDISEHGVQFLNIPMIDRLDECGFALNNGNNKFGPKVLSGKGNQESNWIFSFARVKKLRLNIFGGSMKDAEINSQTAWKTKGKALRMRREVASLAHILMQKEQGPHLNVIKIAICNGKRGHETLSEEERSFWTLGVGGIRARYSLFTSKEKHDLGADFSNENFILQPLEALRGVSTIKVVREGDMKLPDGELSSYTIRVYPWWTQRMMHTVVEAHTPNPELVRHVEQMEDALDQFKDQRAREREQFDNQAQITEDRWIDQTMDDWMDNDEETEDFDFDETDMVPDEE